jgi:hypothetical protein
MRFSINVPNFGDFADASTVARVASAVEEAGWDALFLWDHVVHDKRHQRSFGDPWMLLTAAALATAGIRLGPMVTPVPRRRPQQLARQVSTLDNLSAGRVIFGAGLGGPIDDEYGSFGEPTDPRLLAERLDEGLHLLDRYWSGEPVTHAGRHYQVQDATLCRGRCSAHGFQSGSAGSGPIAGRCDAPRGGRAPSRSSCPPGTATPHRSRRSAIWSHTCGPIATASRPIHSRSSWAGSARPILATRAISSVR